MWTISLPLRVAISKNKEFPLNLNQYRNAHFHVLNKAKENFTELALKLIKKAGVPKLAHLSLEYILYPGTRQLCDVNNICCVEDKFFSDTLVHAGILEDDNYTFIADTQFKFGSIDRENPRVDVIIRSSTESEQSDMKVSTVVTLSQLDMSCALREFLAKNGVNAPNGELTLTLDSGSGYQLRFEQGEEPAKPHKKQKLDPKTAMEKVAEAVASKTPDAAVANLGAIKTSEVVGKEPPPVAAEAPPFDPTPKEATKPLVAESAVPEPTKEPEVVPPPPAKTSLFANFKRPSNEPAAK